MIKTILSIVKPNELENYAKEISEHNFFELFSDEKNSFKIQNYSHFLYFGEEESKAYINDYMLFFTKVYPEKTFDIQNFFCVFEYFKTYLEREDVYLKYKTMYGSLFLNKNTDIVANLMSQQYLSPEHKPQVNTQKYFYPFFEYLESKVRESFVDEKVIIEKLESEDLMYIQEVFMDKITPNQPPFYLNPQTKTYKFSRQLIVNNILQKLPTENAYIISLESNIVGIIFVSEIESDKAKLYIMTDMDYMDSNFSNAINAIKILYKGKCKTLVIKNINRGLASSNLNTACILAHFKPDYDNSENIDGYTQYDYKYTYNLQDEVAAFSPSPSPSFPTYSIK